MEQARRPGIFLLVYPLVALFGVAIGIAANNAVISLAVIGAALLGVGMVAGAPVALLPWLLVSLLPSDYIMAFRFKTPMGMLKPFQGVTVLLLAFQLASRRMSPAASALFLRVSASVGIFGLVAALSTIGGGEQGEALRTLLLTTVLGAVGPYLILLNETKWKAWVLVSWVKWVGVVVAILSILEYVTNWNPYGRWLGDISVQASTYQSAFIRPSGYLWRAVSTVGNPLVLSGLLVLILGFVLWADKRSQRKSDLLAAGILSAGVATTLSRSGYVAIPALLAAYTLIRNRQRGVLGLFAVAGVIVAMLLSDVGDLIVQRVLFQLGTDGLTHRLAAYGLAGQLGVSSFMGIGFGSSFVLLSENSGLLLHAGMTLPTFDNGFLTIFAETGLVGLVSYLVMLMAPVLTLRGYARIWALVVFLCFSLVNFSFVAHAYSVTWVTYWTLQAIIARFGLEGDVLGEATS